MTITNGLGISDDGTCLGPAMGAMIRDAIIPEGVKTIGFGAFDDCAELVGAA